MAKAISERIPPHNKEAEISVLGAILINSEVFLDVSELIRAEDFYEEAHKEIFSAITQLHMDSKPIDLITVSECLSKRHSLEAAGGRAYVASLADAVPTSANAREYAKIIAQKASLRSLIGAAGEIVSSCYEEKLEPETILDTAEQNILAIAQEKQSNTYVQVGDVLNSNLEQILEAKKNGGIIPGLTSGFKTLDIKTTGFSPADFIIVAARPSMGKTAFALNIAQNAALKAGARVVIFSLEMSREQLGMRMLAMESRVDSKKLKMGDVSNSDLEDIENAIKRLSTVDIIIDDTPGLGVMEMRNKCRRIAAKKPIDLIVIDYLQMMTMGTSIDNRVQEVSTISRYLKQLAREMKCPVICLSQLSRAVEQRQGNHKPILSDLRESGAIEQDADMVLFLYREDYYKDKDEEPSNTCEIIIAKNRNGETGVVELTWLPKFTKFADMAIDGVGMPMPKSAVPQPSQKQSAPAPKSEPAIEPEAQQVSLDAPAPGIDEFIPMSEDDFDDIKAAMDMAAEMEMQGAMADDDIDF